MVERVRDVIYSYVINIHGITKVSDALKGHENLIKLGLRRIQLPAKIMKYHESFFCLFSRVSWASFKFDGTSSYLLTFTQFTDNILDH
jgi:hypothetical protein